jgi:CHAT domain-containing protein
MTHDELRRLAEQPVLAESISEMHELFVHLKECRGCWQQYDSARQLEKSVAAALAPTEPHLTRSQIKELKTSGFLPGKSAPNSAEEWHAEFCRSCQRNYRTTPSLVGGSWRSLAVALVGLAIVSLAWFYRPHEPTSDSYRSANTIPAIQPEAGAPVSVWESFQWAPVDSVEEYRFRIVNPANHVALVDTLVKTTVHILTPREAAPLQNQVTYEWQVSCHLGSADLSSQPRRFTFTTSVSAAEYHDFSRQTRDATDRLARTAEIPRVPKILEDIKKKLEDHPDRTGDRAWLLKTQADLLQRLDRNDESLASYEASLAVWDRLGQFDEWNYARTLVNHASAAQNISKFSLALTSYTKALDILTTHDSEDYRRIRATCLLDLGTLYRRLGLPAKAQQSYEGALAIDRTFDDPGGLAEDLTDYGNLLVDELNDPKSGLENLQEALSYQQEEARRTGTFRDSISDTLDSLAYAYRESGEYDKALQYYQQAVVIDQNNKNITGLLQTLNSLGDLAEERNDLVAALEYYQKAINLASDRAASDQDDIWRSYDGLGSIYLKTGRLAEAEKALLRARALLESVSAAVTGDERGVVKADRTTPYYGLAQIASIRGDPSHAVEIIEQSRAFTEMGSPRSAALDTTHLQRDLHEDELALQYKIGLPRDPVLLTAISTHAVYFFRLPPLRQTLGPLRESLQKLAAGNQKRDTHESLVKLTSDVLPGQVKKFLTSGAYNRLIVSPDGPIDRVPFEALIIGTDANQDYLLQHAAVSIVPSFGWWIGVREESRKARSAPLRDALVLADPLIELPSRPEAVKNLAYGSDLQRLPSSRREAEVVRDWANLNSVELLGSRCSSAQFRASKPEEFTIIHFATHAASGSTLESAMLFLGTQGGGDTLTGLDLKGLHLGASLVVLSACNSGIGQWLTGDGGGSLPYSFLLANAKSVIATRWRLPDKFGPQFMTHLYRHLARGDTVETALRAAQLEFASASNPDPALWAVFEAFGYGDQTVTVKPRAKTRIFEAIRNLWPPAAIVLVSVLLAVFAYRSRVHARRGRRSGGKHLA